MKIESSRPITIARKNYAVSWETTLAQCVTEYCRGFRVLPGLEIQYRVHFLMFDRGHLLIQMC